MFKRVISDCSKTLVPEDIHILDLRQLQGTPVQMCDSVPNTNSAEAAGGTGKTTERPLVPMHFALAPETAALSDPAGELWLLVEAYAWVPASASQDPVEHLTASMIESGMFQLALSEAAGVGVELAVGSSVRYVEQEDMEEIIVSSHSKGVEGSIEPSGLIPPLTTGAVLCRQLGKDQLLIPVRTQGVDEEIYLAPAQWPEEMQAWGTEGVMAFIYAINMCWAVSMLLITLVG